MGPPGGDSQVSAGSDSGSMVRRRPPGGDSQFSGSESDSEVRGRYELWKILVVIVRTVVVIVIVR